MKNYSKEQTLRVIGGGFAILAFFKFNPGISAGELATSIDVIVVNGTIVVGFIINLVGWLIRLAKGDVNKLGRRI